MNIPKRSPSSVAFSRMAFLAMALGGIRPVSPLAGLHEEKVEDIELHKRFLAMLPDANARLLWSRRFRRGLTASEAEFIKERVNATG